MPKTWMLLRSGLHQYSSMTLSICMSVLYLLYVYPMPILMLTWHRWLRP